MRETSRNLAIAITLALLAATVPTADARADMDQVRDLLVGRTAVCKIDMPVYKGVVLSPQGQLEEKSYYKRLKKHRPAFTKGDRAEITKIEIQKTALRVCLNGCGVGFIGPGSRIVGKLDRIGASINIDFGAAPASDQLDPTAILAALSGVVAVEGIGGPGAAPAAGASTASPAQGAQARQASIDLLSVEVDPPQVSPGEVVRLVMQFEVAGSGFGLPLSEERQLYLDDAPLLESPRTSTETWHDGRHRTLLEFHVPADAAPGAYVFEGTLRGAGAELKKRAIFLVGSG